MKKILFRAKASGHVIELMRLKDGNELTRNLRQPTRWNIASPTREANVRMTVPSRVKKYTAAGKPDGLQPRGERAGFIHTARSSDRQAGSERGGPGFRSAARGTTRIADKLKMTLRTDPAWFGDEPMTRAKPGVPSRQMTNEEATGRLRKTYMKAGGFVDDPVRRTADIAAEKARGGSPEDIKTYAALRSGVYHPLRRDPRS